MTDPFKNHESLSSVVFGLLMLGVLAFTIWSVTNAQTAQIVTQTERIAGDMARNSAAARDSRGRIEANLQIIVDSLAPATRPVIPNPTPISD